MDNGLDITTLRCALALHGALYLNPRRLAASLDELTGNTSGTPIAPRAERDTARIARRWGIAPDWRAADAALSWRNPRRAIVVRGTPIYPPLLAEIPDPPCCLFVEGASELLNAAQIAVVGSRSATARGRRFAFELAQQLVMAGWRVTSGLASGIDGAAHAGALAGHGATVAVLGCGIDRVYPPAHAGLARQITVGGAVVSEFPLGTAPQRLNFPLRNRIISGLSVATVVVEATTRSGSLITAEHALEQGRDVFAVPGAVDNPQARGCNALIKQGAQLLESAEDLLTALPDYVHPNHGAPHAVLATGPAVSELSADHRAVLAHCSHGPTGFDTLAQLSGLTVSRLSSILLELEMAGALRALSGGHYERADTSP
jgi:DNA processing protein